MNRLSGKTILITAAGSDMGSASANAICPGTIDTPFLQGRIQNADDPTQAKKNFIARQPIGRLAKVDGGVTI